MSWAERKINELGDIVTGKTPSTKVPEYFGGEYPFVTPSDIDYGHYYVRITETTVTEKAKNKHKNQFIPKDAVLFTCIGNTMGKCAIASQECISNQQINSVVANDEHDPKFLYYLLHHNRNLVRGIGMGGGAATPIINKTTFGNIKLKVPADKAEQEAISALLEKYDNLIENNKRRIELLEESARQLYKEWFVRFQFPGHEHVTFVDGVPEGWTAGRVGDTAKVFSGYAFKSKDWLEEGNPVIKIKNITSTNTVDVSDCQCVDDNVAEKAAKFKLSPGDMLIAMTGATVGKVGLMPISERTFYLNQRVGKFESKIGRDVTPLLLSFFNSEKAQSSILNLAGGAAQPNISAKQIESIEFPIPPETLLNTFLDETENLFTLRLNLVDQIFRLTQARDLLLPKLMNGEIAV